MNMTIVDKLSPVALRVKRVDPRARMPTFGTAGAACFDLYAVIDAKNPVERCVANMANTSALIETGLAFEVPPGFALMIYSRSGQGFKDNTRLANCVGVIDSDYRGLIRVKLTRDDGLILEVAHGDRIAQAMLVRVPEVEFIEVDSLSETARGDGAYGSTGR